MGKKTVRIQKGMSLQEYQQLYGTEQQCYQTLSALRWPKGFVCPECGYNNGCLIRTRGVYECYRCGRQTSLTAGTIFHSTKTPLATWFLCIYLMTQSKNCISIMELSRQLGVAYDTAWRMKHKLMQVMLERDSEKKLKGNIEMDDSYLGGERSGGKRGRGAQGKTPFVAAVEKNESGRPVRIKLTRLKGFRRKELERWSKHHLEPGSIVVSDGLDCFTQVTKAGCVHNVKFTGSGRRSAKHPAFKWVNTVLGNLKNAFHGTYHSFHPKHAPRYLAEFQYRFNRRFNLRAMLPRLVYVAARTSPWPERLLVLPDYSW